MEKMPQGLQESPKNTVEVETPFAKFNIVYSLHNQVVDPEVIREADALILELIGNYQTSELVEKQLEYISKPKSPYSEVIKLAAEKQKPIFLVDLTRETHRKNSGGVLLKNVLLPVVEAFAGVGLVLSGIRQVQKQKDLSRRDFLKLGAKGTAAAYLALPQVSDLLHQLTTSNFSHEPDEDSLSRKSERFARQLTDASHPELHSIINTRNDLIAEKSEAIAKMLSDESGKKPNLSIIIGAKHTGLEDSLKTDFEERKKRLDGDLGSGLSKEKFIAKIEFALKEDNDPQKYSISILEDPALK